MSEALSTIALSNRPNDFDDDIEKIIEEAGYAYDKRQDIFYSILDPWQKKFGYCELYDESAAPMGMILDFEPIRFRYNDKNWLIELWKGQYDLCTGCEIGVYNTSMPAINLPGFYHGTFYMGVDQPEFLDMSYTLLKDNAPFFRREGEHWWLTGFRVGEFSHRHELKMEIKIELLSHEMRDAFVNALLLLDYKDFDVLGNTVSFEFGKPHSHQPLTRDFFTDCIIQLKNKQLCNIYNVVTKDCVSVQEKILLLKHKYPQLYYYFINMGKARPFFQMFDTLLVYFH